MIIRNGTERDIPEIIDLLRVSLGEKLIPKSEALWRWKHLSNPFGKSPVLLAEEEGRIVGVRAFMNWGFSQNGQPLKGQRAVDTAVHPDFQGRGIFSKLTQKLVDKSRLEGVDFIFNTPNSYSTPGYLKLGWEKWARLPIKIRPTPWSKLFGKGEKPEMPENLHSIFEKVEKSQATMGQVETHCTKEYLKWRYLDCPILEYGFAYEAESHLLIYRTKDGKWGKELRVCDLFLLSNPSQEKLINHLNHLEKWHQSTFTSISGLLEAEVFKLLKGFLPPLAIGPQITLRDLSPELNPMNLPWAWSLGDLEVF